VCLPLLISPCTAKSRSFLLAPAHRGGPGKRAVKRLWYRETGSEAMSRTDRWRLTVGHHWHVTRRRHVLLGCLNVEELELTVVRAEQQILLINLHHRVGVVQHFQCTTESAFYSTICAPQSRRSTALSMHHRVGVLQHFQCTTESAFYSTIYAPQSRRSTALSMHHRVSVQQHYLCTTESAFYGTFNATPLHSVFVLTRMVQSVTACRH